MIPHDILLITGISFAITLLGFYQYVRYLHLAPPHVSTVRKGLAFLNNVFHGFFLAFTAVIGIFALFFPKGFFRKKNEEEEKDDSISLLFIFNILIGINVASFFIFRRCILIEFQNRLLGIDPCSPTLLFAAPRIEKALNLDWIFRVAETPDPCTYLTMRWMHLGKGLMIPFIIVNAIVLGRILLLKEKK